MRHQLQPLPRALGGRERRRRVFGGDAWGRLDQVQELGATGGGHSGCVNALSWSDDGQMLLSGSDDRRICIWTPDTSSSSSSSPHPLKLRDTIVTGHTMNIFAAVALPHASTPTIVSCAGDSDVRVFEVERLASRPGLLSARNGWSGDALDGAEGPGVRVLQCHRRTGPMGTKRIATENSPHLFLTVGEDGTVRQHDLRRPQACRTECPDPLFRAPPDVGLYSLSISAQAPHLFCVAGQTDVAYLCDRRMGARAQGWGTDTRRNFDVEVVRRFGLPEKEWRAEEDWRDEMIGRRMRRWLGTTRERHATCVKMSKHNSEEVVVAFSPHSTALFSIHDTPADMSKEPAVQPPNRGVGRVRPDVVWFISALLDGGDITLQRRTAERREPREPRPQVAQATAQTRPAAQGTQSVQSEQRQTQAPRSGGSVRPGQQSEGDGEEDTDVEDEEAERPDDEPPRGTKAPRGPGPSGEQEIDPSLIETSSPSQALDSAERDDVLSPIATLPAASKRPRSQSDTVSDTAPSRNRARTGEGGSAESGAAAGGDAAGSSESSPAHEGPGDPLDSFMPGRGPRGARDLPHVQPLAEDLLALGDDGDAFDEGSGDEIDLREYRFRDPERSRVHEDVQMSDPVDTFDNDDMDVDEAPSDAGGEDEDEDDVDDEDVDIVEEDDVDEDDFDGLDDFGDEDVDDDFDEEEDEDDNRFFWSLSPTSQRSAAGPLSAVPCVYPRRLFRGALNSDTVKDCTFLGDASDKIACGSDDGTMFVWDKKTGRIEGIWKGDDDVVNVMEQHPTLPLIAVSGIDNTVKLFAPTPAPKPRTSRMANLPGILERVRQVERLVRRPASPTPKPEDTAAGGDA